MKKSSTFVTTKDGKFMLAGRPYYFAGANFWQGMNMGVSGPTGDRDRLVCELEQLEQLGITNLRVMAASEGPDSEPYRMTPALMTSPGVYDEHVLDGLDFLLAEMGKRGMKAVLVLSNFWEWSGGMSQYVSWHDGSRIPYPNESGDYEAFSAYSARFYACEECQAWYRDLIRMLVERVNPYTQQSYRDDPAVFAWELANEPRRYPQSWIDDTAAFIKSIDPNHMVTTGSEGNPPSDPQGFEQLNSSPGVDYATIHIWPQNWGWYDPADPSTYADAEAAARRYLSDHEKLSAKLGRPFVLEEFGLARDSEVYAAGTPTSQRDRFYQALLEDVFSSASTGGPAAGANFWAWSGEARPGDRWIGDPPHETPGWYSVYKTDNSTEAIISNFARAMNRLPAKSDVPVNPE